MESVRRLLVVARTVVVPMATAVSSPFSSTLATASSSVVHETMPPAPSFIR